MLRGRVLDTGAVSLTWRPARGATSYQVEWDAGEGTERRAARGETAETTFVDDLVLPGTYRYWVTSLGPGGASPSVAVIVQVPIAPYI